MPHMYANFGWGGGGVDVLIHVPSVELRGQPTWMSLGKGFLAKTGPSHIYKDPSILPSKA